MQARTVGPVHGRDGSEPYAVQLSVTLQALQPLGMQMGAALGVGNVAWLTPHVRAALIFHQT